MELDYDSACFVIELGTICCSDARYIAINQIALHMNSKPCSICDKACKIKSIS